MVSMGFVNRLHPSLGWRKRNLEQLRHSTIDWRGFLSPKALLEQITHWLWSQLAQTIHEDEAWHELDWEHSMLNLPMQLDNPGNLSATAAGSSCTGKGKRNRIMLMTIIYSLPASKMILWAELSCNGMGVVLTFYIIISFIDWRWWL
jgi:hypothetical protein